jgi:hypothetical protein
MLVRENKEYYHLGIDYVAPERSHNGLREMILANI